ncbi:NAD(P)-dependent oxidoreductase [Actinomycetospora cinnamomea]|uniref:3-hydroxyisobutyrate dehydrogenase-like beta-hydroxyacid dehydrogenase n=1 Tax=Actinomycetospora cinnamomea TaxID=663609 RepID=A0A2U1FIF5_9PSEU|nr:NAD(P)-dependent oxidoreductase [Actinomycetospora cinnamomea]PVZ11965.1 3-hydroxyisobutyrate dehydrogenase-like beta-hydroxyacid dehydrogenase [Actinomycetospora cinnamomea]
MITVGVVAPGAMGVALASCLAAGGHRVLTSLDGRSPATAVRAHGVLEDAGRLDDLVTAAEVLLLVVPPGAARAAGDELAAACTRTGARPLVVEMDAVAPTTVTAIAAALPGDLVDGAISGPPPGPDADVATRVFLSGPRADEVARLDAPGVRWLVLDGPVGAASAAKMCTASVRKGHQALLAQAFLTAAAHGVLDAVLADLRIDFPDTGVASAASAATKAWRFVDEMTEIAATQADAGLTSALAEGLEAVYRALATSAWGGRRPEDVPADLDDPSDLRPRP